MSASQQSIQKVVAYALKYFSRCGEDLWDCIVEACQKGSINTRINILYFLDTLCESSLLAKAQAVTAGSEGNPDCSYYVDYVSRDLATIVEAVVPEGRQGLPNLMSTRQILESWRTKRVIEPHKVDEALSALERRREAAFEQPSTSHDSTYLPREEVFKRIEADRERHKRLRERRWVQPVSHNPNTSQLPPLASFMPLTSDQDGQEELTLDIEFENDWETTSSLNEDDDDAFIEENGYCFMTRS
ncbi:hypothetical protein NLI96_g716 [Meripilus lineatus]|uniref:CID domain-containing protein n=1 Tax=Meripilus lineatus TaxID=2056292 RepID=A0AAD5YNP8_9APHY|nr:hypothetical protein NLI96_g716 [Physisporinus lineatus]